MPEPIVEMSKSEYARHAGVSKGRISQQTTAGGLLAAAVMPNGKINVALADRLRGKAYDPSNNQSKPAPLATTALPLPSTAGLTNERQLQTEEEILEYRRRSAAVKAQNDEISLAERKGQLVHREKLKSVLDDRLKTLFTNLRSCKQTISDRLIGEGLAAAEGRAAMLSAVGEEIEKMIDDFRRSLTAGTTDA